MANWDVFHSDRLEVERGLPAEEIQARRVRGELHDDDLVRPAGTTLPWKSLIDTPAFGAMPIAPAPTIAEAAPPAAPPVFVPEPEPPSGIPPHSTDDLPPPPMYGFDDAPTLIQARDFPPGPSADEIPLMAPDEESQASRLSRFSPMDDPPTDFRERPEFASETSHTSFPAGHGTGSTDRVSISDFLFDDDDKDGPAHTWAEAEDEPQEHATLAMPADLAPTFSAEPEPDLTMQAGRNELIAEALIDDEDETDAYDPQDEDEEAAEFTLARSAPETVEELDLAAMVDVAFQLVLFFLVTATTVLYKSLEVPRPADEKPPEAAVQGRGKSLEELSEDFILVEIDAAGNMKVDREGVPADLNALITRLRASRQATQRNSMLLLPDYNTPHRVAVVACDAANEIGLNIKFGNPKRPDPK